MKNEGHDWVYLNLRNDELKEYLLSEQIFWQLSPAKERLTIGNLLLAEKKLSASVLTPAEKSELEEKILTYQEIRSVWKTAWNEKAKKEWLIRLNLWQQYLNDLRRDRENSAWSYSSEVKTRVILQILEGQEINLKQIEKISLNSLDRLLKSMSRESNFVWDEIYSPAFPENEFWFLYRSLIQR